MGNYIIDGIRINVIPDGAINIVNTIPTGTYFVKEDSQSKEIFLERTNDFKPASKIYGDAVNYSERIINTFMTDSKSTGVLLSGLKGAGKTLQAKDISSKLVEKDIPTIIVNSHINASKLSMFIISITEPLLIIFDEFEKIFKKEQQEGLLTLFDGILVTKKLFVITCNLTNRLNSNLINRTGRIRYHIPYDGLPKQVITEYCNDKLDNKKHADGIHAISDRMEYMFSFDMLQTLVDEMNLYQEDAATAIKLLNMNPPCHNVLYKIRVVSLDNINQTLSYQKSIWVKTYIPDDEYFMIGVGSEDKDDNDLEYIKIYGKDLVSRSSDEMVFRSSNYEITFTKAPNMDWKKQLIV